MVDSSEDECRIPSVIKTYRTIRTNAAKKTWLVSKLVRHFPNIDMEEIRINHDYYEIGSSRTYYYYGMDGNRYDIVTIDQDDVKDQSGEIIGVQSMIVYDKNQIIAERYEYGFTMLQSQNEDLLSRYPDVDLIYKNGYLYQVTIETSLIKKNIWWHGKEQILTVIDHKNRERQEFKFSELANKRM